MQHHQAQFAISPGGKGMTFIFDALDGKKFITTLMDFDVAIKVQSSLKVKISEYRDKSSIRSKARLASVTWLENFDLKEKVDDQLYE